MTPHPHDYANILNKILEIAKEYGIEFEYLPKIEFRGTDKEGDPDFVITVYYESGGWCFFVTDNGFLEHNIREHLLETKKKAIKKSYILKGLRPEGVSFVEFFKKVLDEIQKQKWADKFSGYFTKESDCCEGYISHILVLGEKRIRVDSPYQTLEMSDYPKHLVEAFNYEVQENKFFKTIRNQEQIFNFEKNITSKETNHETSI